MSPSDDHPGFQVLRSLVEAAGGDGPPIHADVECTDYDWHVPFHFSGPQMAKVNQLGASLAETISPALGEHLRQEMQWAAEEARQCFGFRLEEELGEKAGYRIVFGTEAEPCGWMQIGAQLAAGWVAKMLGGDDSSAAADKKLSDLEAALLADTVTLLLDVLSKALEAAGAAAVGQIGEVSRELPDLPGGPNAEYCIFGLKPEGSQAEPPLRLAVLCDALDPICRDATGPDGSAASPEAHRAAMMEHFARVPIAAAAIAGRAELTMRDMLALEAGDVLLLPQGVGDPIQLWVQDRCVCCGYAVTCDGRYGVAIDRALAGAADAAANGPPNPSGRKGT